MKRTFLLLACAAIGIHANAQSNFYVTAGGGIGLSNIVKKVAFSSLSQDNMVSHDFKAGVGYKIKKWRIETGLEYFTTGSKQDLIFTNQTLDSFSGGSLSTKYAHISVPLQVGYAIPIASKFTIVPTAGVAFSYNLGETWVIANKVKRTEKTPKDVFKKEFNQVSGWAKAGVRLEYKLNERFEVVAGPDFQYMLTNFYKVPDNVPYKASQYNYSFNFDLGLKVNI